MNIRQVSGMMGVIFSGLRFLLPMITFWGVCKKKEVGQRSVIPYGVTWCNCVAWTLYALPMSSWLVAGVNMGGLLLVPGYFFLYLYYSAGQARSTSCIMLGVQVVWAAVLVIVHFACFNGRDHEHAREQTFGILGSVTAASMYSSALIDTYTVYKTKSVEHMSILFVLASLCNSIAWVVYASKNRDLFILVPNALGILVTAGQIGVWFWVNCCQGAPAAEAAQPAEAQPA